MANASVNLTGYRTAGKMRAIFERELADVVDQQSQRIREHIRNKMREPKNGRIYIRRGGRIHQASAPGQFPAVDYGNLINKLRIRRMNRGLTAVIGTTDVKYAPYLEGGTRKMKPRPYIKPTFDQFRPLFVSAVLMRILQLNRTP